MGRNLKTLVFGASTKPHRYSHQAVKRLRLRGHDVIPVGLRKGDIDGLEILTGTPELQGVHTITMYVNPLRQTAFYKYLLGLNPVRIIFNPGTENPEFAKLAHAQGVKTENSCTLVLLSIGQYDSDRGNQASRLS